MIEALLSAVTAGAACEPDVAALLLVGSHARGGATASSDLDLVILTADPERYLEDTEWARGFGTLTRQVTEDWGKVQSLRVWYAGGLEVEFGLAAPDGAAPPLDAGARSVIADGFRIFFDRQGSLARTLGDAGQRPG